MKTTWYVQLSKTVKNKLLKLYPLSLPGYFNMAYERGNANMKILPKVGDDVLVLSEKNIICTGSVVADFGEAYGLRLKHLPKHIYTGVWFRRNWTVKTD
jgi:hypothetical protein